MIVLHLLQLLQFQLQSTGQSVRVHVLSVSILLHVPPFLAGIVIVNVLVLDPGLEVLIPLQVAVAVQALQVPQFPMQLTEQSVFWHVLSVSVLFADGVQVLPPLLAALVIVYVLVLVPGLGAVVLTPSQVAAQSLHSPQFPMQLTEQSVFWHVESVSLVLFAIRQGCPPLIATVLLVYVLVLFPVIDVALTPSQVAAQALHTPQFPMQLTEQSVLVHIASVSVMLSAIGQVRPPLLTGLVIL